MYKFFYFGPRTDVLNKAQNLAGKDTVSNNTSCMSIKSNGYPIIRIEKQRPTFGIMLRPKKSKDFGTKFSWKRHRL